MIYSICRGGWRRGEAGGGRRLEVEGLEVEEVRQWRR